MDIMKGIAFDNSVGIFVMNDNLDPLYQVAMQMKIENVIDATSYLISVSQTFSEQAEYRKLLENIINSYSKENEKNWCNINLIKKG